MNVLGGLTRPSAGQVIIDGENLLKLSARELTAYRQVEVGFVWQQGSRNLIPYLSALDNIKLPMTLAGRRRSANADKRARELMDLVDLSPALRSQAHPALRRRTAARRHRRGSWPTGPSCSWPTNPPASSIPPLPIRSMRSCKRLEPANSA